MLFYLKLIYVGFPGEYATEFALGFPTWLNTRFCGLAPLTSYRLSDSDSQWNVYINQLPGWKPKNSFWKKITTLKPVTL